MSPGGRLATGCWLSAGRLEGGVATSRSSSVSSPLLRRPALGRSRSSEQGWRPHVRHPSFAAAPAPWGAVSPRRRAAVRVTPLYRSQKGRGPMRRPSASLVVAVLAIVIATAGTASATTALITSHQIKNGTIRLVDISKQARNALHGKTGRTGNVGAAGPQGSPGPQGVPGPQGPQGMQGA